MPELPEMEIAARRLGAWLGSAEVESAVATGVATLKTFDPPLDALAGKAVTGVRRIGKLLVLEAEELALMLHLMSAGRLVVSDKRGSLRDRRTRLAVRLADGRELRLREFGTRQAAWAKLLHAADVEADEYVATLGPEAWPAPPSEEFARLVDQPRHLHPMLRDQRTIAGIGRTWVDEILWRSRLSPFKKGADLDADEVERLRDACESELSRAITGYEEAIGDSLPEKMPKPVLVHRRQGEPCPRCGAELAAVHFAEHLTTYCPEEQTGGRVLKDRRLSRLLK